MNLKEKQWENLLISLGGDNKIEGQKLSQLAAKMMKYGTERDGPVREIFFLIGDRWSSLILLILEAGELRHASLREVIGALASEGKISQRMLTLKLRALEKNGLITRSITHTIPPRVDYALSSLGREIVPMLDDIITWVNKNHQNIEQARIKFLDCLE